MDDEEVLINTAHIDGGYLVDGSSFKGRHLMYGYQVDDNNVYGGNILDMAQAIQYSPLVHGSQVHRNIANSGNGDRRNY